MCILSGAYLTAVHVVSKKRSFTIRIEDERITIGMNNMIILIDDSEIRREDGLFSDIAIYKLTRKFNDIRLSRNLPELRNELHSIS